MIHIVLAFIIGFALVFIAMMSMALLYTLWPVFLALGLVMWFVHEKNRRCECWDKTHHNHC